ncbi:MAG: hypothetical protein AAGE94_14095 [Acidobacteriota bacterium]
MPIDRRSPFILSIAALFLLTLTALSAAQDPPPFPTACVDVPFVLNPSAPADTVDGPDDFLPCSGFPYALCYYSGPEPMPCELAADGKTAECACAYVDRKRKTPAGTSAAALTDVSFVDKTSILNQCIADETQRYCDADPDACAQVDGAPVCWYMANHPELFAPPDTPVDVVSTFSAARVSWATIGCTNCPGDSLYAGCMTAPCQKADVDGDTVALCQCPVVGGTFQIGQTGVSCDAGVDSDGHALVWSASASSSDECPQMPSTAR